MAEQRAEMLDLLGDDFIASDIAGGVQLPFTPPEYAQAVWTIWGDSYFPTIERQLDGTLGEAVVQDAKTDDRLLTDSELVLVDAFDNLGLVRSLTVAMRGALSAALGATEEGPHGGDVLTPETNARYWDSIDTVANMVTVANASQTRWEHFVNTLRAVPDTLEKLGDSIGRASAKVAETAGRTLGAGAGGFFDELGIAGTVIMLGAGFAAFKVVF
jgi:hypothetical protein